MNKAFFAKALAWLGAALVVLGKVGMLGKFSSAASDLGPLISAAGIHYASQTGPAPK